MSQPTSVFLDEFHQYMDEHGTTSGKLLVLGDLNFHYGDIKCQESKKCCDILHSVNLHQHADKSTHKHEHTLDIITSGDELQMSDLQVHAPIRSDQSPNRFNPSLIMQSPS